MRLRRRLRATMLTAAMAALLLSGCQQKFTRVNYETVYLGMHPEHVRDRLGEPTRRQDGNWLYVHRDPAYQALIRFARGQVASKRWAWGDEPLLRPTTAPAGE
ncbi:MAG: hypothetical protein ACOC93_01160 [Planctomycetota bacterium]